MATRQLYTQRTLKALRDKGVMVGMTEHFNPYAGMDKPPKYLLTNIGGSATYILGQTITQKEFNDENAKLFRSNLKKMDAEVVPDGKFGIRQDLFGFIDMIAVYPGPENKGFVGVQSTGPSGFHSHKRDITNKYRDNALRWLAAGGRIELWSWQKEKLKPGAKAEVWRPKIYNFTAKDFEVKEEIDTPVIEQGKLF
mgnify:FL=1